MFLGKCALAGVAQILKDCSKLLHSTIQVGALPALIAAAIALEHANDDDVDDAIDAGDGLARFTDGETGDDLEDLQEETFGAAGFIVGIAALAIIVEFLMIILRFCNVGLINLKINIFLIVVGCISDLLYLCIVVIFFSL